MNHYSRRARRNQSSYHGAMSGWQSDLEEPERGSDGLNTSVARVICYAVAELFGYGVVCVSAEARTLCLLCGERRFELRVYIEL
jgi:hypothetical protein